MLGMVRLCSGKPGYITLHYVPVSQVRLGYVTLRYVPVSQVMLGYVPVSCIRIPMKSI